LHVCVSNFYELWKKTTQNNVTTVQLQLTETSYGLASVMSFGCPQCDEDANRDGRKERVQLLWSPVNM